MKKSLFCVMLILVLLFATVVPCFATQSDYEFLISKGYSEDMLSGMPDEYLAVLREKIGNSDIQNVSTSTYYMYDDSTANYGTIKESSLKLQLTTAEICGQGTNNIGCFLISASWEWAENKPVMRAKDAISVNWDASLFNLMSGGFYAQDWYKSNASDEWTISNEYSVSAEATQGGIGHWTDLDEIRLCVGGGMILTIQPNAPMTVGTTYSTSVNMIYAHDAAPVISQLGFSIKGFSVGIDFSRFCDTMAATTNIGFSR